MNSNFTNFVITLKLMTTRVMSTGNSIRQKLPEGASQQAKFLAKQSQVVTPCKPGKQGDAGQI